MHFSGEIFFNFDTYDVWRIYTTLQRASRSPAVTVTVTWRPFLVAESVEDAEVTSRVRGLAACEAVRADYPAEYERFGAALLTLAYQEKDDPGTDKALTIAARVAGLDGPAVIGRALDPGLRLLRRASAAAQQRGVTQVPTIVRQGPPLYIKTTGAAGYGDSAARLELINRMLEDDGIWALAKP
jgi:predicted DsbA family dithiol-disulfide isomerase